MELRDVIDLARNKIHFRDEAKIQARKMHDGSYVVKFLVKVFKAETDEKSGEENKKGLECIRDLNE